MRNSNMIIEFAVLSRFLKSRHMASLDLWLPRRVHKLWHWAKAALWWFPSLFRLGHLLRSPQLLKKGVGGGHWLYKVTTRWFCLHSVDRTVSTLSFLWTGWLGMTDGMKGRWTSKHGVCCTRKKFAHICLSKEHKTHAACGICITHSNTNGLRQL